MKNVLTPPELARPNGVGQALRSIKKFSEIRIEDMPQVGGKNASLGEMFYELLC